LPAAFVTVRGIVGITTDEEVVENHDLEQAGEASRKLREAPFPD
jgi:spore germination protein YaaH